MKIISWNIAHSAEPWRALAKSEADVALLQEAGAPPTGLDLEVDDLPWETLGGTSRRRWRTAIVRVSSRVRVRWHRPVSIADAAYQQLRVSLPGTLAVADVEDVATGETITLVSMYASWEMPIAALNSRWIYADAAVHRLISDLSCLIGRQQAPPIVAAGDLNILRGYGENGSLYWGRRYATIFDRMTALGLPFVGPEHPNGICAEPWPRELPRDSKAVPTYRTRRVDPTSAARQLDFVFASEVVRTRLTVTALNKCDEWGPSDHCQVLISIGSSDHPAFGSPSAASS